ncbi:stalk domain-containing protein [Paenibacillus dakarensis]|uniref:stalk domain-containing protein n=1 Tax=Paenibacillus dakarensis TaxID=1527293 RepID=UPI0006D55ECF|nr:stalk domain-containing protein [Paenibacillus dakarensis]
MKLKKLSIVTVLALSQVAAGIPASAEAANKGLQQGKVAQEARNTAPSAGEVNLNQKIPPSTDVIQEPEETDSMETEGTQDVPTVPPVTEIPSNEGEAEPEKPVNLNELILYFNSTKMEHGGKVYNSPQPMQVKKGVSYVPIRALVDRVGFKVTYDKKTKETVIIKGKNELRFKTDSNSYTVNGVKKAMKGTSYQTKNTFMVPLTAITQALNIPYKADNVGKRVIMSLETKPVAKFTIEQKEVLAGETFVTYKTETESPLNLPIVDERWEGKQDIFDTPGDYIVSYSVQDAAGNWSDPYTQTITVTKPNEPPVASFTTDKAEYKMGELITITDESYDDDTIMNHQWENKAYAFFTPGPKTIKLTVTDNKGLTSTFETMINITNETLYNENDFNMLFIPEGEKFIFDSGSVPSRPKISYMFQDEASTLIRSNSPETVNSEGIVYRETAAGDIRFMIHHVNNLAKNVKMYVVATNLNDTDAELRTDYLGFAGPTYIATAAGKKSVLNYFQSMQDGSKQSTITIKPNERKLVMLELSKTRMKTGDVISLFSDVYSDAPLQFDVIMIDEKSDPLTVLDQLPILDRDGVHNRGTYPNSTRVIRYMELVGSEAQRLTLGDNLDDPNLQGMDPMYGEVAFNTGNFGVLYKITLDRVAPNTLVSFNPRGGKYSGYAMVNGSITAIYSAGQVKPDEQAVLYRTGEYEQKVEILLTAAPGSNLPVNLLFTPLPK